jgi:hypothetical protein
MPLRPRVLTKAVCSRNEGFHTSHVFYVIKSILLRFFIGPTTLDLPYMELARMWQLADQYQMVLL